MKSTRYVAFRRKREGRTNYNRRLKLIISEKPRLIVRKTNTAIIAQVAEYFQTGDKILASANSAELKKLGWKFSTKNICAAYLTGLMLGKRARDKGVKDAVLDIGFNTSVKGCKIYGAAKGFAEMVTLPLSQEICPDDKRIKGEHIAGYFSASQSQKGSQFSAYRKGGLNIKNLPAEVESIRQKIAGKK